MHGWISRIVYFGRFPIEGPFPMILGPDRIWSSEGGVSMDTDETFDENRFHQSSVIGR